MAKCDLGFRFGNLKLKFDMLVEWNILVHNFVEMWYLCEVIALICFKILPNVISVKVGNFKLKFDMLMEWNAQVWMNY